MALVKNGELVTSSFVDVSGAESIPASGAVIVSLDQWKAQRDALLARGELRAVGEVLLEQLFFMLRTGFDAFEIQSADPLKDYRTALADFSVWYQPTADGRPTAMQ